MPNLVGMTHST